MNIDPNSTKPEDVLTREVLTLLGRKLRESEKDKQDYDAVRQLAVAQLSDAWDDAYEKGWHDGAEQTLTPPINPFGGEMIENEVERHKDFKVGQKWKTRAGLTDTIAVIDGPETCAGVPYPVVSVSGRSYTVNGEYRLGSPDDHDLVELVQDVQEKQTRMPPINPFGGEK